MNGSDDRENASIYQCDHKSLELNVNFHRTLADPPRSGSVDLLINCANAAISSNKQPKCMQIQTHPLCVAPAHIPATFLYAAGFSRWCAALITYSGKDETATMTVTLYTNVEERTNAKSVFHISAYTLMQIAVQEDVIKNGSCNLPKYSGNTAILPK